MTFHTSSAEVQPKGGARIPLSEKLRSFPQWYSQRYMHRVNNHLFNINKMAYQPKVISIGPYYHREKDSLYLMEEHKFLYLQHLLQRTNDELEKYITAIKPQEEEIRNCYAKKISLNPDELVDMMVLDGCFIVELVRKFDNVGLRDNADAIFKIKWIMNSLQRDLMLLENQVPFFVLLKLFGMVESPDDDKRFVNLILNFFKDLLPDPKHRWSERESSPGEVKHILDLIHKSWVPSVGRSMIPEVDHDKNDMEKNDIGVREEGFDRNSMRCVTELREAGVKIRKKEGRNLFDISFASGTLEIPPLVIEDRTESFLRNLIAYEQYLRDDRAAVVSDYVILLDSLINTWGDVAILSRREVLHNWLGDMAVVSRTFNKLTDYVIPQSHDFYYEGICKEVNAYCNKSWNHQLVKLRHNYFDSPWKVISIIAATILLLLTMIQTFFAAFPRN